jgi:DMSO/TMAO reductase YedYZ molybdopterin-dependent catalytic subunit
MAGTAIAGLAVPGAIRSVFGAVSPPVKFGGATPNADFYITSYSSTPAIDAASWKLEIKGLVENPVELSYEDIKRLPRINEWLTLECISNPPDGTAISNAEWVGTKLKPILDRASVSSRAVWCEMRAADGYHTGLPVEELLREENFLPYLMNGVPLPPAHGYPVRIFIPGKYGMKQPKWITQIEFLDHQTTGYWEARGWSNTAWRKVNSGFFSPKVEGGLLSIFDRRAKVTAPVDIWGWALAGPSGIRQVEVSTDDGATWHDAQLVENSSHYEWTVWKYRFAPTQAGIYMLRVRATDGNGVSQPPQDPQTGSGMSGQARMGLEVTKA